MEARARKHAVGRKKREVGGAKGFTFPSFMIYSPGGAALLKPRLPCALTAANAVRRRQPGPTTPKRPGMCAHTIIMARKPRGRDIPSRPPPRRPLRERLRRLKRRARNARSLPQPQPFNGMVPYQVRITSARPEPRLEKSDPRRVRSLISGDKSHSSAVGATDALGFRGLLINNSRVGWTMTLRVLQM
jgi:hypothetical protein